VRACVAHEGTVLCKCLAAVFALVWTLNGMYCLMHAQALSLLEGFAALFALIVSCIIMDLAIENTTAILNNKKTNERERDAENAIITVIITVITTYFLHLFFFNITGCSVNNIIQI